MFGYVMPNKSELKFKHYYFYRAFYCGICKSIKKTYGEIPRCLLSYDITFYALLLTMIDYDISVSNKRCMLKAKKFPMAEGKYIDKAADLNILLAYYKLLDNANDDNSLVAKIGCKIFASAMKKAKQRCNEQSKIIENMYQKLSELEKLECWSVDIACEPFAIMMKELAELELDNMNDYDIDDKQLISKFAFLLGKWIYIIDATEDYEKDVKDDSYNPFRYVDSDYKVVAENILFSTLKEMGQLFDSINNKDKNIAIIIENIIFSGLLNKTDEILGKRSCEDCNESIRSSWVKRGCNLTRD